VRCTEHGELLHVADSAEARAEESSHVAGLYAGSHVGHDHEHCVLVLATSESATVPGSSAVADVGQDEIDDLRVSDLAFAVGADVYRLAPKTSPPIAA
jgi:hypothetical protein